MMTLRHLVSLLATLALLALALPATAQDRQQERNPQERLDGSWVVISGTVTTADPDGFRLDYGSGLITVEMDDWDWYAEDYELLPGDKVTVYGAVDHDTYEVASIEAASVYVENLGTYFHAGSRDDEGRSRLVDTTPDPRVTLGDMVVVGVVTRVGDSHFVIDSNQRRMTVDTTAMPYNPLDDEGNPQIAVGDKVSASGRMDENTLPRRELVAESVVVLRKDAGKPSSSGSM
ncbi:MAG: DUF5666 domain-containing protein [Marinobacter sp.]|uniref:DUF5666 domain-containing protein n=1 Tax=Marinobacter sp. TaxID=50741 RepID=UPI00299ED107|nr:DUF5666 domain-containing protein [Marinobacter sp.]MDX1635752.1 DUF5666 domain-containing protein [Marinobacter sp.]